MEITSSRKYRLTNLKLHCRRHKVGATLVIITLPLTANYLRAIGVLRPWDVAIPCFRLYLLLAPIALTRKARRMYCPISNSDSSVLSFVSLYITGNIGCPQVSVKVQSMQLRHSLSLPSNFCSHRICYDVLRHSVSQVLNMWLACCLALPLGKEPTSYQDILSSQGANVCNAR